jgi:hypothetical protein
MNKKIISIILMLTSYSIFPHGITNGVEQWRRLGDNITTIAKTKYFARLFKLDYLYTPFTYHDDFAFATKEKLLTQIEKSNFSKIVLINSEKDILNNIENEEPTLFVATFLSPTPWMYTYSRENPDFEKEIKQIFTPLATIEALPKSPDTFLIALHVRKGGGYDWPLASTQEYLLDKSILKEKEFFLHKKSPEISSDHIWPIKYLPGPGFVTLTKELAFKKQYYADYIWPIKFPPDQYYIEQIKMVAQLVTDKQLLVVIFTDDPNPLDITERFAKALSAIPNLKLYYRTTENHHTKNVIHDLFTLTQCDCVISASSSFAFAAHLLGDHAIMVFPEHAITCPDKIIIDKVKVITVENSPDAASRKVTSNTYSLKTKLL